LRKHQNLLPDHDNEVVPKYMASAGHMLCADVCLVKSKSGRLREYMSMRYGCLGLRCVIICSRQLVASAIGWMITAQQVRAAPPGDDVE